DSPRSTWALVTMDWEIRLRIWNEILRVRHPLHDDRLVALAVRHVFNYSDRPPVQLLPLDEVVGVRLHILKDRGRAPAPLIGEWVDLDRNAYEDLENAMARKVRFVLLQAWIRDPGQFSFAKAAQDFIAGSFRNIERPCDHVSERHFRSLSVGEQLH